MSKIKQVLRLHKDGMSNRRIGRELGLYKDTVNKYVNMAEADPLGLDKLLEMDDPVLDSPGDTRTRRICWAELESA